VRFCFIAFRDGAYAQFMSERFLLIERCIVVAWVHQGDASLTYDVCLNRESSPRPTGSYTAAALYRLVDELPMPDLIVCDSGGFGSVCGSEHGSYDE
jgi:hypothetical protein